MKPFNESRIPKVYRFRHEVAQTRDDSYVVLYTRPVEVARYATLKQAMAHLDQVEPVRTNSPTVIS
jgi:hypothetical protein